MDPIEEIKRRVDIVELISEYTPLKKMGRNLAAQCPFHQETKPSFMVSPDRQIFRCFGCEAKGDIFAFLERKEGLTFPEALETLAKRAGVNLPVLAPKKKGEREKMIAANSLTAELYCYLLQKHHIGEKAREYLKKRAVTADSIEKFQLGYAPSSSVLAKFFEKRGFTFPELSQAGLVIARGGGRYSDRFYDRLIFPIRDLRGQILGFSGRIIETDKTQQNETGPKYLNSPETPIFKKGTLLFGIDLAKDAIREEDQAILVEGEFDVITSHQVGVKNVVAVKGTALTGDQISLVGRFTENMAICFDTDLAGDAAARRGIEMVDQAGMNIKVVQTGNFKDADEMVKASPQKWRDAVKAAVPVYDWLIDSVLSRYDRKTAEGKKKIGQELLPIFSRISDELVKAHYLERLAQKLDLETDAIYRALRKTGSLEVPTRNVAQTESPKSSKQDRLAEQFLALLLQGCDKVVNRDSWPEPADFTNPTLKNLFERIIISPLGKKAKAGDEFHLGDFITKFGPELSEEVDRLMLLNFGEATYDQETFVKELAKTALKLEESSIRGELADLSKKIKSVEREGKQTELLKLQRKFDILREELVKIVKAS